MLEQYLVFLCVVLFIKFVWTRLSSEVAENLPPGTLGLPVIGETLEFIRKKIGFFTEKHRKYGRVFKTHLLGKRVIRVYGADNLRKIIKGENKIVQSSYPLSVVKLIGAQSLSVSQGDEHKSKKRELMKYMGPEFVHSHLMIFADTIAERLRALCEQPEVDLFTECRKLFIELAAKYLVKIDISDKDVAEIREQYDIFSRNLFSLPVYCPGFGFYKAYNAKQKLREIFARVINNNETENDILCSVLENYRTSGSGKIDVRDDELFLDAIIELLFFGAETVSSAGFALVYKLTKHETFMTKLQDSLKENGLLDDVDVPIGVHNVTEMTYLDAVVKEALRVLPPVGGAYRKVIQSFELDGYTIPAGWSIAFGIRDTHHNDTSISDPLEFNPDRWLEPDFVKDRYSFLPFGGGTRTCPGQLYAKTLLKVFVIELARNCHTGIVKDSELDLWPTPKPRTVVMAKFTKLRKTGWTATD